MESLQPMLIMVPQFSLVHAQQSKYDLDYLLCGTGELLQMVIIGELLFCYVGLFILLVFQRSLTTVSLSSTLPSHCFPSPLPTPLIYFSSISLQERAGLSGTAPEQEMRIHTTAHLLVQFHVA